MMIGMIVAEHLREVTAMTQETAAYREKNLTEDTEIGVEVDLMVVEEETLEVLFEVVIVSISS